MSRTMRAVVIDAPGDPEVLRLREIPVPVPRAGEVLIRVEAFGLNRSELHFRRGVGDFGSFPRVPGIEAVGTVESAPGGEHEPGTQVAALMGGMGRTFDGGYAEHALVPATSVVVHQRPRLGRARSRPGDAADRARLPHHGGRRPARRHAADPRRHLVRGAREHRPRQVHGATVIATTRRADRADILRGTGADHVVVDTGRIAEQVRAIVPGGVSGAIELIGTDTLPDTLRATAVHGTVCFSGMLADVWTIPDFYPMDVIPNGVRLTAYSGEASDLPASVLQGFLDAVAAGTATVPLARTYALDEIVQAHQDMEDGARVGKVVVVTR